MKKIHKLLLGLFVAAVVAIPVGIVVAAAQSANPAAEPASRIVRIAADPTNTPVGGPCHGGGC